MLPTADAVGSIIRSQAPVGAKESEWEINCYGLSFAPLGLIRPSLSPRLTPWAIILRLSEANIAGA